MTKDEAIAALRDSNPHVRLMAARFFVDNGGKSFLTILKNARNLETDAYVKRRLEKAIEQLSVVINANDQTAEEAPEEHTDGDAVRRATEWVGGLLLHEMEGPIGRAAFYASTEIVDFGASRTKKEIDALRSIFGGIEQLVKVSKAPQPREIDLPKLIEELVTSEVDAALNPSVYGPRPFIIKTDPDFLRLALANGLRNAAEAVAQGGKADQAHQIVATWGETDHEYWVSIIDHGPGISGSPNAKFEIGNTSKAGHRGFGLAVAMRAMESLGGIASLQQGAGGGARYEVRWGNK